MANTVRRRYLLLTLSLSASAALALGVLRLLQEVV
jgi:hypothetical protein